MKRYVVLLTREGRERTIGVVGPFDARKKAAAWVKTVEGDMPTTAFRVLTLTAPFLPPSITAQPALSRAPRWFSFD